MKVLILIVLWVWILLPSIGNTEDVSPLDQCRQYAGIIVREKDRSQLDLAVVMARVEQLEKDKKILEDKIKGMESKEKEDKSK